MPEMLLQEDVYLYYSVTTCVMGGLFCWLVMIFMQIVYFLFVGDDEAKTWI